MTSTGGVAVSRKSAFEDAARGGFRPGNQPLRPEVFTIGELRRRVADHMVRVHRIDLGLVECHVEVMTLSELFQRLKFYTGMELSAAVTNPPEGSTSVAPASDAPNDDGRHGGAQPCSRRNFGPNKVP